MADQDNELKTFQQLISAVLAQGDEQKTLQRVIDAALALAEVHKNVRAMRGSNLADERKKDLLNEGVKTLRELITAVVEYQKVEVLALLRKEGGWNL